MDLKRRPRRVNEVNHSDVFSRCIQTRFDDLFARLALPMRRVRYACLNSCSRMYHQGCSHTEYMKNAKINFHTLPICVP